MPPTALRVLVASNNPTDAGEVAGDIRLLEQGLLDEVFTSALDPTVIESRIVQDRIDVVMLDPLAAWNTPRVAGDVVAQIRERFREVRFLLYGSKAEKETRIAEFTGSAQAMSQFYWLDTAVSFEEWKALATQQLRRLQSNLAVKRGCTRVERLASATSIPESVWRLALVLLVLGLGLAGFQFLPDNTRAILWLIFCVAALPLAMAFFAAGPMKSADLVKLYAAGLRAIPFIGRLAASSSSRP